jgi:hypothetical protein
MVVGFREELNATRVGQLSKRVEDLGGILLQLFQQDARDTVADLEAAAMLPDQVATFLQISPFF